MKYKLYCLDDSGKKLLQEWDEKPSFEAYHAIVKELAKSLGVDMYYTRSWKNDDNSNETWIDFGSWSVFCILEEPVE